MGSFIRTWFPRIALLLLAISVYPTLTQGIADSFKYRPAIRGALLIEIPPWAAEGVGIFMWGFTALFVAYLLSLLRDQGRKSYGVIVLASSAVIAGYVATKLQSAITFEQIVALLGASFGAIDGFASLRASAGG